MSEHRQRPAPKRSGPKRLSSSILLVLASFPLWGCATDYVARTGAVRSAYQSHRYEDALLALDQEEKRELDKDRLLVLLDKGMVLHSGGRYEESIQVLAEAEKLADQLEVISVSEEAATLLINERERAYRGEDFEKLMINVLQALNYARLGRDEDALVEVRRADLRLKRMVDDEKKPYEQLAIARYLGGVLREDQKDYDSAFIDYYKAWKLQPSLEHLGGPLVRLAKQLERAEYEELRAAFPEADEGLLGPDEGEVVVIVEAGLSPEKSSLTRDEGGQLLAVPMYRDRWSRSGAAVTIGEQARSTVTVTNLEAVATLHLNERIGRMIAKSLASTAVKAGLAAGVGALAKDKNAGLAAFALMTLVNQPDLRSWLSLPAEFQLARFRLPKGTHAVKVECGGRVAEQTVEVVPGRIGVVVVRSY
ncbi:MAG: hypothetical protein WBV82_19805 [Myxococcaceae bacterium]